MDIKVLRSFAAIVDEGSFAAAARRLGISKSTCSKMIADLEADLGTRLLTRTTRAVTPTAAGHAFHAQITDILTRLDAAFEGVRAASARPAGPLKLGVPVQYTLKVLQPHLMRFMEEYPDIQLDVVLDDSRSDMTRDGFDAVIRIGTLEDSSLHARRLHDANIMLVASPDYIARHGSPQRPADLRDHQCLHYTNLRGPGTWPLRQGSEVIYQKITPAFSSNNGELLRALAVGGKGIALAPEFQVADDLAQGLLVPVLPGHALPGVPIHLVYSTRKLVTASLAAFLDFAARLDLD
ncbi:LysR family transcriptional regulator [Paracoccus hibiscisoli]|uniref:LysR family transcriptional regulator n=1 Tax=Paracoccus hibiscisoli TaxID=2023261 RepID=A0A4U0QJJ6_9RHOB|nr:LysR family transcriptional regulator [Paracoccus hibiscisoli]TJZ81786.1 LysR family transcriptional regulator [Paracoccus hibiscisoli]